MKEYRGICQQIADYYLRQQENMGEGGADVGGSSTPSSHKDSGLIMCPYHAVGYLCGATCPACELGDLTRFIRDNRWIIEDMWQQTVKPLADDGYRFKKELYKKLRIKQ